MKPIIIVNFKTYEESTGRKAVELAKIHDEFAENTGAEIMIAVQNADIYRVMQEVSIPVLAQHMDPVGYGSNTGKDLPECLRENGARGAIINHSEDRVAAAVIEDCIQRCRELRLKSVVCAESIEKVAEILKMKPDYLAFEDPELIGTGRSVSTYNPESVRKFAVMTAEANRHGRSTIPLCGAGITNGQDVRKSIELGVKGVLLASGVVKSEEPLKVLKDLAGV